MSQNLRWGILGVAKINDRLLPGFRAARNAELRGIASRSADRAAQAATAAGIPLSYGSYAALLADPEIDAVYLPLPNTAHDEWTRKAADAGKHILCEKPLTPTAAEAESLVAYCADRKVALMDGFMWPHHPRTAELKRIIDAGTIGRVMRVDTTFTFPLDLNPANIRLQPGTAGGSLLDVGCYPVYGIRWAFGEEPVRVFASATFEYGVDLAMSALLWFADGRIAGFDCGFTLPMRQHLHVTGTKGVIRIPQMWVPDLGQAGYEVQLEKCVETTVDVPGQQIARMIEHFGEAITMGQPIAPSPIEAVKTLRVCDALARSARDGRVVDVATA